MPIAFVIVPILLGAGVFGALTFASQETEDMSPAEQTKRLNTSVSNFLGVWYRFANDVMLLSGMRLKDWQRMMSCARSYWLLMYLVNLIANLSSKRMETVLISRFVITMIYHLVTNTRYLLISRQIIF